PTLPRVIALCTLLLNLFLLTVALFFPVAMGLEAGSQMDAGQSGDWLVMFQADWIPDLGISFIFGADGLSLLLIILTVFLGLMALGAAWHEIRERTGFFYLNLLWTLAGVIGVFS